MNKRDYLFNSGVIDSGDPDKIEAASLAWDKERQKQYLKTYRQKRKRVELYLTPGEYQLLAQVAKQSDKSVAKYLKAEALAQLEGTPTLLQTEAIDSLVFQLKAIGNNVNQLTRYANTQKSFENWHALRLQLTEVEELIISFLVNHYDIRAMLEVALKHSKLGLTEVMTIVQEINHDL